MLSTSLTTEQLLDEIRGGDQSALNALLNRFQAPLERQVSMRMDWKIQNRLDTSDIVQEVLMEVNRRLTKYLANPVMPFAAWVRQIAKDRIIDAHRRHRVSAKRSVDREQAVFRGSNDSSAASFGMLLSDHQPSPISRLIVNEAKGQLNSAVSQLDAKDFEVISMRHFQHLTNQEIGKLLKISQPAASMRYLRAVRRLKTILEDQSRGDFGNLTTAGNTSLNN